MFKKIFYLCVLSLALTSLSVHADDDAEVEADDKDFDKFAVREEEDVLVLTDDNFDAAVEDKDVILVEFYAPWCGHCKSLAPEYAKAAKKLKEAPVPVALAKVDATVNSAVAQRFDVSGYPTLKFKKGDTWLDYEGPREADGIVAYMNEKADPNFKPPPEAVVTVTKDNFDEFVESAELVLLEFYAPWCGHCKKLAPEYEKAAQQLKQNVQVVPLGKVDATVETELASKFGVSGYPTLKMFRKGREADYNGPREQHGIVDYMKKQCGEAAKTLNDKKDVKNLFDKETPVVIGFFDNLEDEKLRAFMDIANDRREDPIKFAFTLVPALRDMYKVNAGSVVVIMAERFQTKFEPKYEVLKVADKSKDDIASFIVEKQVPLVGQYSEKTDKFYEPYNKNMICFTFYTVDWSFDHRQATDMWRRKVANIAKDYKDIKFAVANEDDYMSSLMANFGLDESGEEFNIGCFKNGLKYRMDPMDEFDEDDIREFMNKLRKDKLTAHIKSQPVPKKNNGPVKVVVGKTFEKIVLDKSKDVLIEMYAPWCGHCKKLEPIFKDLGKALKKEKNLVIAKIDATANDLPENFSASGFPTIYYAPANNKESPLKFDGDRTVEGFKKYLEEKATVSFGKSLKDEL